MSEEVNIATIENLVDGITTIDELTETTQSISNKIDNILLEDIKERVCEINIKKIGLRKCPEFAHDTDVGLDMYPTEVELIAYSGNSYKIQLCDNMNENLIKIEKAEIAERIASPFLSRLKRFIKGKDYRLGWKRAKFNSGIAIEPNVDFFVIGAANSRVTKGDVCLQNGIGIIDPTYRGNIGFFYYNLNGGFIRDSILALCNCCGQIFPAIRITPKISYKEELSETERGTGGFGSSAKVS